MNVFNLSLLTFSVISTVLYVAVLAVVQRNRKIVPFKGHFFCLIKALGLVDLTGIINLHVYSLFRYWLWLDFDWLFYHQSLGWWACLWSYLGTTYTGVNHCFAVFFIAINRYLNISNHQVELWRGRMCRLALLVQFSAPALIVAPLCFQEFFVIDIPAGPNNTYPAARIKDKDFEMIYYLFVNGVDSILVVATGLVYAFLFAHANKLKKQKLLSRNSKSDLRLAFIGFVLFALISSSIVVIMIQKWVKASPLVEQLLLLLFLIIHLVFCFANPYLILLGSKPTRVKFKQLFRCHNRIGPS